VAKSIYAVAGMGFGSCLLLSLMMQHLLKVKKDVVRPAFLLELEELLAGRLDGPIDVQTRKVGEQEQMTLLFTVGEHVDKQRLARAATPIVWRQLAGGPNDPDRLVLAISKRGETAPLEIEAERPRWVPPKARVRPAATAGAKAPDSSAPPAGR
jgi:hypothetical protein